MKNKNRSWPRREDLGFPMGRKGREQDRCAFWECKLIFGMDGQWDFTAQDREMCVIGSNFVVQENLTKHCKSTIF